MSEEKIRDVCAKVAAAKDSDVLELAISEMRIAIREHLSRIGANPMDLAMAVAADGGSKRGRLGSPHQY